MDAPLVADLAPSACWPASFRLLPSWRKKPGFVSAGAWAKAVAVTNSVAARPAATPMVFFFMKSPTVELEGATFHEESAMH